MYLKKICILDQNINVCQNIHICNLNERYKMHDVIKRLMFKNTFLNTYVKKGSSCKNTSSNVLTRTFFLAVVIKY